MERTGFVVFYVYLLTYLCDYLVNHHINAFETDEDCNRNANVFDGCIPECHESLIPKVGKLFKSLEDAELFYDSYASACGFQSRKSTLILKDGIPFIRYILCNRQGTNENSVMTSIGDKSIKLKKRKTTTSRVNCMARIVLHFDSGVGYRVKSFIEGHSHAMVPEAFRHLMKCNRNVGSVHKLFIHAGIKANIGPVRSFRIYKELCGSYQDIGATSIDFRNYARDLRAFVDGADAQIIIENFKYKEVNCSGFKFFFDVDESGKLNRLFWADDTSIKSYKIFGDAVSFDATYSTNRYKLIFTPFTGRDNHGGCVNFAAALISHEDIESYKWVMERFLQCMSVHPKLLITDQDPALRKVIPEVFPTTHHRFCLWHITKKIPDKISASLRVDPLFKSSFDGLIWSESDEPHEFEQKWNTMMDQYGLSNDKWFCDMFDIRSSWISAYFRDVSLSSLFKTTSLSESENSFFKCYMNHNDDLVRFQMHYDSAIDAQRSSFKVATLLDETSVPQLETDLLMEQHASTIYTHKKFYEVQVEIVAAVMRCVVPSIEVEGNRKTYYVDNGFGIVYKSSYDSVADFITCSCNMFVIRGIPCRHMVCVMRTMKFNVIPQKYILLRWSKLSQSSLFNGDQYMFSGNDKPNVLTHQFLSELGKSIAAVQNIRELEDQLLSDLRCLTEKFSKLGSNPGGSSSRNEMIESFYGCKYPESIQVLPPNVVSTKGSGASGRIKSFKEKAISWKQRPLRKCRSCNRMVNHDSRNCPDKDKEDST